METRETKDAVDTIAMKSRNMSANIAKLARLQEETNGKLDKLIKLLEEDARRTRIRDGR